MCRHEGRARFGSAQVDALRRIELLVVIAGSPHREALSILGIGTWLVQIDVSRLSSASSLIRTIAVSFRTGEWDIVSTTWLMA